MKTVTALDFFIDTIYSSNKVQQISLQLCFSAGYEAGAYVSATNMHMAARKCQAINQVKPICCQNKQESFVPRN